MSYSALINDNVEAQLSQNTLKSITNQTSVNTLTGAQISVGKNPSFIMTLGDYIYVANSGSNNVSVIDPRTNTVIENIAVGLDPSFIGINATRREQISVGENPSFIKTFGDYIYVANSGSDTVSVINAHNNTVLKNIDVGDYPSFISITADSIYVANSISHTLSVINPTTDTVIENITLYSGGRGLGPRFIETYGDAIYVANIISETVSVINTTTNTVIENIPVGENPSFIETYGDAIYVADSYSHSNNVSVINTTTNTVIENIPVGLGPSFMKLFRPFLSQYTIYVANNGSNSVSVINTTTNTVIENIPVGLGPSFIETYGDAIYVANSGSNSVSVINTTTNTVIENIPVGLGPSFIETYGDAIYVANSLSNTVSLIDPLTNEEVAGMKFDIKPFGAGQIICDGLDVPRDRFLYVTSGAKCLAKPTAGFEFSSWSQNLPRNTNVTINASTPSDWFGYPLTSLRESFTDDPAATLTVNRFGNFTAYFRALPPPVPAEFTASLITAVVAALAGSLLIPATLNWHKSKKQTSRLNSIHLDMVSINKDGLNEKDIGKLNELNQIISNFYAAGKITNEQNENLKNEVFIAFQEIFKKRIESLTKQDLEAINKTRNDIIDAYNNGKLSSEYYTNLKNEVSNTYQKIFKKRIESITGSNTEAVDEIKNEITSTYNDGKLSSEHYTNLNNEISAAYQKIYKRKIELLTDPDEVAISKIKNYIKDAYADGKLTGLHYDLLNEKMSDMFNNK